MEIHDEGRNWIFTNNGVGTMPQYSDMYLYKKKYIKDLIVTTRENALTGYRNDIEDFDNLSIEIYKVRAVKRMAKWLLRKQTSRNVPVICLNYNGKEF